MFPNDRMKGKGFHPAKVLFFIVFLIGMVFLVGAIVMLLWNAILPEITGVKPLNLWQAIGILLLSKILFGGFGWGKKRGKHRSNRRHWKEKWMSMSEEERNAMKEKWKKRCRDK